jgi:hypothetical protein
MRYVPRCQEPIRLFGLLALLCPAVLTAQPTAKQQAFLQSYCTGCHNQKLKSGGLALDSLSLSNPAANSAEWEKAITKLRSGMMPPPGAPHPPGAAATEFRNWLEDQLDAAVAAHPNPGRTEIFHRLNRTEYQNAIRDLLHLEIDAAALIPADDSSGGFDNMAGTLRIEQSLMERYLSAARTIARLAVGSAPPSLGSNTYRAVVTLQQSEHIDGLPLGTRGGMLARHTFPRSGEYLIRADLTGAQRVTETHKFEISVDGEPSGTFTLAPRMAGQPAPPAKFEARVHVDGGPHDVVATFFHKPISLIEQEREPFENPRVAGNDGGKAGAMPEVAAVTIIGPYTDQGAGSTPSRQRLFVCQPAKAADETDCARRILTTAARRAVRGTPSPETLAELNRFYATGRRDGGSFDSGIEFALRRLLVDPEFLFRVEADPAASSQSFYKLGNRELASRLSFFLWSSIPDDELLDVAERGKLTDPAELQRQMTRMLADPRASSLSTDFAGEWLQLRNLDLAQPGDPYVLSFDETLRRSLQRETELFFASVVRENRPAIELLTARYTFLNERLATHYGIPNVQGSDFRRVELADSSHRGGLLGQGSILTITSHPNRTSPVLRGKWVLKNLLGTPPADPPPNVPALVDRKTQARTATMRERMAQHRDNPACANCHNIIDPAGFALENYDAIGRWRTVDESFNKLDTSGALPDGSKFTTPAELRAALASHPERFANTLTERLMTWALGRVLEPSDMPAVRAIVRNAARDDYRFQSLVRGVVQSPPFLMRRIDRPTEATGAQQQ